MLQYTSHEGLYNFQWGRKLAVRSPYCSDRVKIISKLNIKSQCEPTCTSYSFHQRAIQYVQMSSKLRFIKDFLNNFDTVRFNGPGQISLKYAKTMAKLSRAFHEKSSEISLCSIILNLAEDTNVIFEQKATYPANMFISDIGGSAGLILGKIRTFEFFEFEF